MCKIQIFPRAVDRGFDSWGEAFNFGANEANKLEDREEAAGVCAVVRIRLKQQIALTREGFQANLDIENRQSEGLTNIRVEITMREAENGVAATHRFSIGNATHDGDMTEGVPPGAYSLGSRASGGLEWLFIPYSEAAPTGEV